MAVFYSERRMAYLHFIMDSQHRSLFIALVLLWLILESKGSPEIGFSARLTRNFDVPSSKLTVISNWENTGYSLLFEYGIDLRKGTTGGKGKERAVLPFSGLFLVSANLMTKAMKRATVKVCITKDICQETSQNEHTITIAIQSYFAKSTVVSVKIFTSQSLSVLKGSSFAVQFLGPNSKLAGFSAIMPMDRSFEFGNSSVYINITGWMKNIHLKQDENRLIRGSTDSKEKLAVRCSGMYLVTVTLSFFATKGFSYEVRLVSNKTEARYIKHCSFNGIAMISFLKNIELSKDDELSLQLKALRLKRLVISKRSRLSAVYIGKSESKLLDFVVPLKETISNHGSDRLSLSKFLLQNITEQKNIKVFDKKKDQIVMPKHGVYIITLYLTVKMSNLDTLSTEILVYDKGLKTLTSLYGQKAHTDCSFSDRECQDTSFVLTGVLALEAHDYLGIYLRSSCKHSFTILKGSWVSFIAVRSHDFAAGLFLQSQPAQKEALSKGSTLILNATSSNVFPLNEMISADNREFRCPLSGIYIVAMNLVILNGNPALTSVNIRVVKRSADQILDKFHQTNYSTIFEIDVTMYDRRTAVNPTFVRILKENDILSFHISANSNLEIRKESSLFLALIDFIETGRTFLAKYNLTRAPIRWYSKAEYVLSSWIPKTRGFERYSSLDGMKAPKSGTFLVSCYVHLECRFGSSVDVLQLSVLVYFDDKDADLGLKDRVELMSKGNDTVHFYLSVNGILEARKDALLKTLLKSNKHDLNISVVFGELSVSLNSPSEDGAEIYRSLQSSTQLLSFRKSSWVKLDRRIYANANGEFKSESVEFLGSRFQAQRSCLAFVSATTVLHGVNGVVEYGIAVDTISGKRNWGLTTLEVSDKYLRTLKWTGLVHLEPWQQVGLEVRVTGTVDFTQFEGTSRTSWSSLAFMALSFPESADVLQYPENIASMLSPSDAWYMVVQQPPKLGVSLSSGIAMQSRHNVMSLQNMKKGEAFDSKTESYNAISLPQFKFFRKQRLETNFISYTVTSLDLSDVFGIIHSLALHFKSVSFTPCVVGILKIDLEVQISSNSSLSLEHASAGSNFTLFQMNAFEGSRNDLEFNGVVCLNLLHAIVLASNITVNLTILRDSLISFALIDSSSNIEGFSVSQTANQFLLVKNAGGGSLLQKYVRLDNWSIGILGFDSTLGFKTPFGSFISQTDGRYLASANIILKANLNCKITISLHKNGHFLPRAVAERFVTIGFVQTVNLVALLSVAKWDVLELKIGSDLLSSTILMAGSTFSVLQLDQDVSNQRCEADSLQLKPIYEKEIAKRIGADIVLNCSTTNSRIVDFYWLRNNKVIKSIRSSASGTLLIRSASFNDSGYYACNVQIGDFYVVSHGINVIVYDPTPQIRLANQTFYIPENSPLHQVLTEVRVRALTPDKKKKALVYLKIEPENMRKIFYLSPDKTRDMARLKSWIPFNFEARNYYELKIVARNLEFMGNASSSNRVQVRIIDRNDNAPQFEKTSYNIKIMEDESIGTTLLVLQASDNDTGINAEIQYNLHESFDSHFFHIEKRNGTLTLKKALNIGQRRSLSLFVIATNAPFSTFCEIVINVVDVNDNRPYFKPSFYEINVTDTTIVGTIVAKVVAYDLDIDPKNKLVTYRLKHSDTKVPFSVEHSGDIKIKEELDRYAGEAFTVQAAAFDGLGLESSNYATIVFRVLKTTTVPSYYSGLRFVASVYRIKVREDIAVGTLLTTVKAYNPNNAISSVRYLLIDSKDMLNFSVSEGSGEIRTSSPLDYERQNNYSLTVFACDVSGASECTVARVHIDIEDVNDNFPQFTQSVYQAVVSENAKNGSKILKIVAVDADSGMWGGVRYSFRSNASVLPLAIGEVDGLVSISGNISKVNSKFLIVLVKAYDRGGRTGDALLDIQILRDRTVSEVEVPKFSKTQYSVAVREDTKVGKELSTIKSSTPNSTNIMYVLSSNQDNIFETNPERGGLFLKKQLDFEEKATHEVYLVAGIQDDIFLRSYTKMIISVLDVNDNRPFLLEKHHVTYLKGSWKPGRFVTRISAVDGDSGTNGQIDFFIDHNEVIPQFSLDAASGDLRVKQIGDKDKYVFAVKACDRGEPRLCDSGNITVHITKDAFRGGLDSTLINSNYTFAELAFKVDQYVAGDYESIRFIAQEVHLQDPYYTQYTQLPPVNWYSVYYKRQQGNNYLRRYVAAEKPVDFKNKDRSPRDLSGRRVRTIRFKYGDERECGELWKANQICNGPLHPGTQYRFQLEIRHKGSNTFSKTGFTKPYTTDPTGPQPLPVPVKDTQHRFPFWIALVAVSSALLLVLLLFLICCCCYWRKKRLRKKNRYEVATQKDCSFDESTLPWKTETESQELTVWFSEDSICNGSISHANSANQMSRL